MTVDVARRPRRRAGPKTDAPEPAISATPSIAIGEIDQTIFECPSCSRPLALGSHRCPGCGTRLVRGVTLGKASGFVALGLAVGLLAGAAGGLAIGLTGTRTAATPPTVLAPAGANTGTGGPAATAAPTVTASPTSAPTDPAGIPPLVRTALVQVAGTNGRLATANADLRAVLAAKVFDASEAAQVLRTISAESVFSVQVAAHVGAWPGSAALATQLGAYYDSVHTAAANGLMASVRNTAAYRAAATAMVGLLDRLTELDGAVRSTAASAGVDLPPATTTP